MKTKPEVKTELEKDIETYKWNNERGGSFTKTICKAISIADMENLAKLYKGFPELVNGYIGAMHEKSWEEFVKNMK